MLPFNAFSIFNFMALVVVAPLAVVFYVLWWKFGRDLLDLLFANLMTCAALYCVGNFMVDNVVPSGSDALGIPGSAQATLFWLRAVYVVGLVTLPTQIHFIICYCGYQGWLGRKVYLIYGAFFAAFPVVMSDLFLRERAAPLARTSTWACVVPWMPELGFPVAIYLGVWLAVQLLCVTLLYRWKQSTSTAVAAVRTMHVRLVIWAVCGTAPSAIVDGVLCAVGLCTIAALPLVLVLMGVLVSTALVKERLAVDRHQWEVEQEMATASEIQRGLLPMQPPDVREFEIVGYSRFASQTGGDTYDFLRLDDRRVMIVLADAAGHGMAAALLISEARALLRATVHRCTSASDVLYGAERFLSEDLLHQGRFVTCFVGLLDPSTAEISYASAGQGPILFYSRAAGGFDVDQIATCPPLGMGLLPHGAGEDRQRRFEAGDFLVLVSDGIYEAASPDRELFGVDRLKGSLLRSRDASAQEIIDGLLRQVDAFVGVGVQGDDMTIVVVRKL